VNDEQNMNRQLKLAGLATLIALGTGGAALAFGPGDSVDLLQSIERGLWQLRATGSGSAGLSANQLCVADPKQLVQIQHGATPCSHYIVRSSANSVTISYSCKGAGQGLTTIRKESARLLQIQSQGIKNSAPFSFTVEGRRAGGC
jgi:hypothetical protein